MSQNLIVDYEDLEGTKHKMILTRLGAGITASAQVRRQDVIHFSDVEVMVYGIHHHHSTPGGEIAPVTRVYAQALGPLTDKQVEVLKTHGLKSY